MQGPRRPAAVSLRGEAWWAAVYGVQQSWIQLKRLSSSSNPQAMGGPLAFSQAIHLALCTLHQCNIFTSVPIWAECQLQLGTLLETPLLTSLPELGRHSSVPPHFTPQEWGQLPQWFLSYPPASASVLLPMLYRSGKAGASGPSRHQQIPSLWVIPVHQPQASCIPHRTWTGDLFHI